MEQKDILECLKKNPTFAIYNDADLGELIENAQIETIHAGQIIFNQGDEGDNFYIVFSGNVSILYRNYEQKEIKLGHKYHGDHFGETALITNSPRNASIRAEEETVLIAIDKKSFKNFIFTRSELKEYFDKFIKYTALHRFLRIYADLEGFSPEDLHRLVNLFKFENFKEGDVVFRQSSDAERFYIIESGMLKVVRWEDEEEKIINFLREGEFFGEKALVEKTGRYATVICLTDCNLFSIQSESFWNLVEKFPKIKKVIKDRIASYIFNAPPIPYKEMIQQELTAFKKMKEKS